MGKTLRRMTERERLRAKARARKDMQTRQREREDREKRRPQSRFRRSFGVSYLAWEQEFGSRGSSRDSSGEEGG